jgi:hypothetical protein
VAIEDVKLNVLGNVTNATLPHILEDIDLTSANADIVIKGNDININGTGAFVEQPVNFAYNGFLDTEKTPYREKIVASGLVTDSTRSRLGIDLSMFVSGSAFVDATYINSGQTQTVTGKADLGTSRLFIEPFKYLKPEGQPATANFSVAMINGETTGITDLSISAPGLSITNASLGFVQRAGKADISKGSIPAIEINDTKGNAIFDVSSNGIYKITADLATLDARPFLSKKNENAPIIEQDHQTPMVIIVNAQSMMTHQDQTVQNTKLYIDIDSNKRFNQLEMDGSIGRDKIYLRYKPNEAGQRTFRFEADNAGTTLSAFGLYDKIRGGKILVEAISIKGNADHDMTGTAQIDNFEVIGAPTLAKILSLMSLNGLASGINDTGIQFTRLESEFEWIYRPEGALIGVKDGRTSGSAVGLTFDGFMDQGSSTIDVSGTIVPVSQLNKIISAIPVIGDVLTGGSGIFAATYSIKGDSKDPTISVNPLSVLAPGIVRKILFEQN